MKFSNVSRVFCPELVVLALQACQRERYAPVGFATPGTKGTIWGMRFIWPIKADYRIIYVAADYSESVIGREKRDYAWIMARSPTIPDADYQRLRTLLSMQGYAMTQLRKVPQQQPGAAGVEQ